jgi:hypothetical protein
MSNIKIYGSRNTCIFLLLFFSLAGFSQNRQLYEQLTKHADSLFLQKDFTTAVVVYQKAFAANGDMGKVIHRYRAASCWAMLTNTDSAFAQLQRAVEKGKFSAYDLIAGDSNLVSLHTDKRWEPLLEKVAINRKEKEAGLPVPQ